MSQTWKDSRRKSTDRIVLKVGPNDDGTYEITVNDEVVGRWVADKRGFCREELAEIRRQLRESGKAALTV